MFTQHYPQILAYARRRVPADADDVVGEVFTTAWRRLDEVPTDALPWLYGVARRLIANARRSAARHPIAALVDAPASDDAAAVAVERASVAGALARLSDEDREILMLVAWEGLTPARASHALGCSVPTFYVRLHRARGRLARALDQAERPEDPSPERTEEAK